MSLLSKFKKKDNDFARQCSCRDGSQDICFEKPESSALDCIKSNREHEIDENNA